MLSWEGLATSLPAKYPIHPRAFFSLTIIMLTQNTWGLVDSSIFISVGMEYNLTGFASFGAENGDG